MSASNDGSESVDQFLARIASLSRKNDEEEAERSRRMEEDMMQARKERRARREERARSISPVKTGPAAAMSSPRVVASPFEPPVAFAPRSQTQTPTRRERSQSPLAAASLKSSPMEASRPLPPPPLEKPSLSPTQPINATSLSRSGTLSWQQRPSSRDGTPVRSRPLSGPRAVFREPAEKVVEPVVEENKPEPTRADIAASLSARDPTWFRQTSDRGLGSAAFRKSYEASNTADVPAPKGMQLPGMAGKSSSGTSQQLGGSEQIGIPTPSPKLPSLPIDRSFEPEGSRGLQPIPRPLPETGSPEEHVPISENASALNRTSSVMYGSARPPSPTKGLGGFVQSAMMKRSDSVSKRWSVQANSGLKRGDSVASNRPTFNQPSAALALGQPKSMVREARATRDGTSSPLTGSRPTSSHGPVASDKNIETDTPSEEPMLPTSPPKPMKSPRQERPTTPVQQEPLLSRSPSKTLDPRRWSPTKASWLESALSKPDSPRPTVTKPEPPAWKVGLERSKSQKTLDRAPSRPAAFDPVATGGLMRSPPPGSPTKTTASLARPTAIVLDPEVARPIESSIVSIGTEKDISSRNDVPHVQKSEKAQSTTKADEEVAQSHQQSPVTASKSEATPKSVVELDRKPPALRPKPETPPKTDFRSALRSRDTGAAIEKKPEPEFKAAFGKLKSTQTQNYVAPDIFKANITRGKAGLNLTGGPQKTKRVDEFKESILQRKEDMKVGCGSIRGRPETQEVKDNSEDKEPLPIPEALARRKTLHKTKASTDASSENLPSVPPEPVASKSATFPPSKTQAHLVQPQPLNLASKSATPRVADVEASERLSKPEIVEAMPTPKPTMPVTSSRGGTKVAEKASFIPASEPISRTTTASPDKGLSQTISNKLAARLNPALGNLIARGNSPKPTDESSSIAMIGVFASAEPGASRASEDGAGLTHMTKARAKGPKRRAPKTETSSKSIEAVERPSAAVSNSLGEAVVMASIENDKLPAPAPTSTPKPAPAQKPAVIPPKPKSPELIRAVPIHGSEEEIKEKPRVASKSPELRRVSDKHTAITQANTMQSKTALSKPFDIAADKTSEPTTPQQIQYLVQAPSKPMPLTPSKTKMNSPKKPNPTVNSPVLKATPKTGLGLTLSPAAKHQHVPSELTPPPEKELRASQPKTKMNADSTLVQFFGSMPKSSDRLDFDTEAFLKAQSRGHERVKTLSNKIVEVKGDGKHSSLSPGQEHILFEDSMYLCVHSFEASGPKSTEVYLWAGDGVGEAALEDVQIFCRKVARENGAKLEVIKQGKEHARFFSALGGILIVLKSKSSALYMLCGRRHGGGVVFDEVDLSSKSLCSGFSFLISAKFGKLYLWIGAGSCADEWGAARLMGMDLGLTGEIEEVSEGKEPAAFWKSFQDNSAKNEFTSSVMWSMRSVEEHKGFPCRLYRVEQERPKSSGGFWGLRASSPPKSSNKASLQEITPFSHHDLDSSYVNLLDTYAAIYVVLGKPSPTKSTDFVSALHIAQELAVLTPSMQDRALLPSCQIIAGEPPHDFKAAFRKWTPGVNTATGPAACLDAAEVMSVLG